MKSREILLTEYNLYYRKNAIMIVITEYQNMYYQSTHQETLTT